MCTTTHAHTQTYAFKLGCARVCVDGNVCAHGKTTVIVIPIVSDGRERFSSSFFPTVRLQFISHYLNGTVHLPGP